MITELFFHFFTKWCIGHIKENTKLNLNKLTEQCELYSLMNKLIHIIFELLDIFFLRYVNIF